MEEWECVQALTCGGNCEDERLLVSFLDNVSSFKRHRVRWVESARCSCSAFDLQFSSVSGILQPRREREICSNVYIRNIMETCVLFVPQPAWHNRTGSFPLEQNKSRCHPLQPRDGGVAAPSLWQENLPPGQRARPGRAMAGYQLLNFLIKILRYSPGAASASVNFHPWWWLWPLTGSSSVALTEGMRWSPPMWNWHRPPTVVLLRGQSNLFATGQGRAVVAGAVRIRWIKNSCCCCRWPDWRPLRV